VPRLSYAAIILFMVGSFSSRVDSGTLFAVSAEFGQRAALQGRGSPTVKVPAEPPADLELIAVGVLRDWVDFSILADREIGGSICLQKGKYNATKPRIGPLPGEVDPSLCGSTDGEQRGRYHTHGAPGGGQEGPSFKDTTNSKNSPGVWFYLATPTKRVWRWRGQEMPQFVTQFAN
jgi:Domain of unknown function (DUF4329)